MNNYFLYLDDTIHGPLSAQVIESMLRAGTILPDTPAAAEGSPEWTTAGQLFNFQSQPTPPPRPPSVKPGGTMPSTINQCGLPAHKPKQASAWAATTAVLVVIIALLAGFLFLQTKRANPTVTMPAPTPTAAPAPKATPFAPSPPMDPAQELRKRAEAGDAGAQYKLARTYPNSWDFSNKEITKEVQEMIQWIKKSAEQGHPEAEYHLANCYQYGKGVIADPAESVRWYRKAATQGVDAACLHIGFHYRDGWGVPKDAAEAAKWFRQGSKSDVYSLLALGRLYLKGDDGVPKDLVQALMCLDLTLGRGVADPFKAEVQKDRDTCAKEMTSEQIAEANRLASEWKP